jgi:prepilin-type N-terminal cleavage/methylation domain-containing protein
MKSSRQTHRRGLTLVEVMVAASVLALTTIAMTQSMLILNRNSAISRVRNLAKALVLGKIQEAAVVDYDPAGSPAVIPTILNTGTTTTSVSLGDTTTQLGTVPATVTWTVTNTGVSSVLSIKCRITYTYLKRAQSYEVLTYRTPDA